MSENMGYSYSGSEHQLERADLDRRTFCAALLGILASSAWKAGPLASIFSTPAVWEHSHQIRFALNDPLEHPFYWWPRTLLSYRIEFREGIDLNRLTLTQIDTGERRAIQFSQVAQDAAGLHSATLHFFSDLPSGGHREFVLTAADAPQKSEPQVKETSEGNTIVLDSGVMRVRIPATQDVQGDAPGPIMQASRGGPWAGSSHLTFASDRVIRINASRVTQGPLFIAYELTYETEGGSRYVAVIHCTGGLDFVRLQENMEGLRPGAQGIFESTWTGFGVTHRQAPNHPFPLPYQIRNYDDYGWERIDQPWPLHPAALPEGELPFSLGIYEPWTAFHMGTFANFWDQHSGDALGVFIDKVGEWQDHEYALEVAAPALQVRYYYQDGRFLWKWPLARGRRTTCIAFYDHEKDKQAMHRLEQETQPIQQDGLTYQQDLNLTSHVLFLQNRYGILDLDCVKDWVLDYPESSRRPPVIFSAGMIADPAELERQVMTSPYVCTLPVNGTRQNGGAGPIPGRNISNFSPVPSRKLLGWWIDGFNRCRAAMNERQRKRLTAIYLFMAYAHAGEDYMPLVPMLSGHPNFLADVKAVPPAMSFLFPDHPLASTWADLWEKCVELNTRYNTRPAVQEWDAHGGRWTEDLGTYVWAYLRPSLRTEFLLRQYDGVERFATPQLAEMVDWLVNALSAPFNGEAEEAFHALKTLDYGHEWGAVGPGRGPRRVHPPQGAHSERRIPPRSLWYLGTCLQRYAPLAAEHAMWAARPTNQDMETKVGSVNPWDAMYRTPDNQGTNPHLRSRKYTGYGIVLRSAVDTPNEVSIHLQQIDQGPNYRWGHAAEGGCGVIYFFAAGKAYGFNGSEDVGDRGDQDTDFCTNFGVLKDGVFRSIGQNVLSRPFYDLGPGQFAEIVPRQDPSPYSTPEHVSRSILLAGHDYFVLYDNVLNANVVHRLSWFVRRGSELPTIKLLRGAPPVKETQRTEIQTEATTGVWFDGLGDSMAVVSHRKDLEVETTPYGCRVRAGGIDDLVFRNPEGVHFSESGTSFDGTAGLIRQVYGGYEFALFHGTQIGLPGITFSTADTELGIGGAITTGQAPSGEFYASKPSSVRITLPSLSTGTVFYADGVAQTGRREPGALVIDLEAGRHHWELTDKAPIPIAPHILRTENYAGGARVFVAPVALAAQYRLELSGDAGATWSSIDLKDKPELEVSGLVNGKKVHVRAAARNTILQAGLPHVEIHESKPSPEYPLYVTGDPPPPPDGLHVDLAKGAATLTWGEVLGITEYRLYARLAGGKEAEVLYRGRGRVYHDQRASIQAANTIPGESGGPTHPGVIEYWVTAVNGNGEGAKSRLADTNPASWRNWDPKLGERFRRCSSYPPQSPLMPGEWPRYYPL